MTPPMQIGFLSGAPGPGELILVFLVVLVLFGSRRLPAFARTLGNLMHKLRRASDDFRDQLMRVDEAVDADAGRDGVSRVADVDDAAVPEDERPGPDDMTDDEDEDEKARPLAG